MPNQIQKIIDVFEHELQKHTTRAVVTDASNWLKVKLREFYISLLHQEIQELEEESKMVGYNTMAGNIRDEDASGYNQCLTDLITKKKQLISELEK